MSLKDKDLNLSRSRCQCLRKACVFIIIAYNNVPTGNNIENVSKYSLPLVFRMAHMLALLRPVVDNTASGYTCTQTSRNNVCYSANLMCCQIL